jgi:hypothetical protein
MPDEPDYIEESSKATDWRRIDTVWAVEGLDQTLTVDLRVECPRCKQPAGFPCFREARRNILGGRALIDKPHKERHLLAKERGIFVPTVSRARKP